MKAGFSITEGKGFSMTFENGWTVSVQFGPFNYCDNRGGRLPGRSDIECGEKGCANAECALISPSGRLVYMDEWGDSVSNHSTPAEVLELMNEAAAI